MSTTTGSHVANVDTLNNSSSLPDDSEFQTSPEKTKQEESQKPPDIEYAPDAEKWKARTSRRLEEDPSLPDVPLPEGFPEKLDSPLVWEGKDWKDEKEWVYDLSTDQLEEIDSAVKHFHGVLPPSR
jgi:hypothetical protein